MSTAPHTAAPPDSTGFLLRRVQSEQARFVYDDGPFLFVAFLPSERDSTGISVNWEGDDYETAESLLAAGGEGVRLYGGVAALAFTDLTSLGVTVEPQPDEATRGHCVLPELKSSLYRGDTKKRCKEIAAKLADLARVRIAPRRIPPKAPPSTVTPAPPAAP